ncbi:(deoxy)nucleoside triphosphate pyrophosphohydrolase [Enterococcus sp. BWB1-3]|uniref:(deoxy)nucleoside triphosphate pyrophosphohydrolase n=1 Tax=Enterococcus sp. BWB1-3 TaxID=2787713 RepID=UPI0019226D8E|nr:(deoxy)nucleoside triphosphate pyrophosphohydrolase [Enterococcus sp. BWB1-3]MBL1230242.1 (deoxy)nucleoside triphosphate pyrophosphohydrolase [Enterococcus sp. BWB1-3]
MKKEIHVVGAVIEKDGLILCAQRGADKSLGGLWEFPGGKIEPEETPQQALEREIQEELLCEILIKNKIVTTRHEYDFGIVELTTFFCELLKGEPKLTEHKSIKWLTISQLETLEWAPADIPTIDELVKGV